MPKIFLCLILSLATISASAKDEIELEVTVIKGNTELPKFLYIVPWKSGDAAQIDEQKLVLHGLFMGVLDPVLPNENYQSNLNQKNINTEK